MTPRDLVGKLDVLHVECAKCDRHGRYQVEHLFVRLGPDAKLTDWLSELTADCARKRVGNWSDACGARCPDLLKLGHWGNDRQAPLALLTRPARRSGC
jgi:hypothetical protein